MTEGLARLLRPRSIAFVGGTQMAGPIRACRRAGYAGTLHVVNPGLGALEGVDAVPTPADLPHPPDAAVVGLSGGGAETALSALAAIGAGGAVVMASGYAETGAEGAARQAALVEAADEMPLIGPNCMGILNAFDGAAIWGDDTPMERCEGRGCAIVSQSGALLIGIVGVEEALPLGYAVSVGNAAGVGVADLVRAVAEDPRVAAIGLYLEGIADGALLGAACMAARARGVPVVALKGGEGAGAGAAIGHTAAMVMPRDLWRAFARRYGIAEASSPKALVETLKLLTVGGVPKGPALSILSYSGGANGLAAERAARAGLELPPPGRPEALRAALPGTVTVANPLDLNVPFRSRNGISMADADAVTDVIVDHAAGADAVVFLIDVPRAGPDGLGRVWSASLEAVPRARARLGIPAAICAILPEGLPVKVRRSMQDRGVPALCGLAEGIEALGLAAGLAVPATGGPLLGGGPVVGARMLDEAQSKARLVRYGLEAPVHAVARVEEAPAAAARLGGPVAVKLLSAAVPHKARMGGVALGLSGEAEVAEAASRIAATTGAERLLIERMASGVEVILGVKRDLAVGLALMIGDGGARAEAMGRFETVLLPLDDAELDSALARLGHDHPGLRAAAAAVARYAEEDRGLVSLDVNPLMLLPDGRALAADALIVTAS